MPRTKIDIESRFTLKVSVVLSKDYQGSIMAITDSEGHVEEQLRYDPWGVRMNVNTWTTDLTLGNITDRGYTMHSLSRSFGKHLDQFGLINTNGRIYDPILGRFLSPDNFIQEPSNSQNYNRYTYCLNNPLKFTDPSGEIVWMPIIIGAVIGGTMNLIMNAHNNNINNFWQGLGYFGIGAAAGAIGGAVGAGVNVGLAGGSFGAGIAGTAEVASTGFFAGFITGASGEFTSGAISGALHGAINKEKIFLSALNQGIKSGLVGGALSGLYYGFDSSFKGGGFFEHGKVTTTSFENNLKEVLQEGGFARLSRATGATTGHALEVQKATMKVYNFKNSATTRFFKFRVMDPHYGKIMPLKNYEYNNYRLMTWEPGT